MVGAGVALASAVVAEALGVALAPASVGLGAESGAGCWQAEARITLTARRMARSRTTPLLQAQRSSGSGCDTGAMREQAIRVAERLEATLRIPDGEPRAIVVVAHPLPTHGGTMRNPLVAALARAVAGAGCYALRFNFRSVGASAGTWTGGQEEWRDIGEVVSHARSLAAGLPVGVTAYSFGALMTLKWLAAGGQADALALVGVPLRSVSLAGQDVPPVPHGTFIVAAEHDQFGTAAELRAALPGARIAEVKGVDHFFVGKRDEVGRLVADELVRTLASKVP